MFVRFIRSWLWIACISLVGCTDNAQVNNHQQESRIAWGISIEGIRVENDSSQVIARLGEPDAIGMGDFNGYILEYTTGQFARMGITILDDYAPDGRGVVSIMVFPPYTGTTEEGVGIGTSREQAVRHHGEPYRKIGNIDIYYFENSAFFLVYDQTLQVASIQMSTPLKY